MATDAPKTEKPEKPPAADSAMMRMARAYVDTGKVDKTTVETAAPQTLSEDDIFGEAGFGAEAGVPSEVRRVLQATLSLRSLPKDAEIKIAPSSAEAKDAPQEKFEYGWCYTDHKTGKEIRKDYRTVDYMNDEPYATRVHAMLEQLGLPAPKGGEIFRGTHHDLLFLNSHGVVVRIGPQDIEDLINPGILQPLGWFEDGDNKIKHGGRELPLTVAIYPGIELSNQYYDAKQKPALAGSLYDILSATNQGTGDVCSEGNTGIIRVLDDDGQEVAVQLLVDADNEWNGASKDMRQKKTSHMREQSASAAQSQSGAQAGAAAPISKGDILFNTLSTVFNAVKNVRYWEKAYEVHQPLRHMFWEAFGDVPAVTGLPKADARARFWETCAAVTNKPREMTLPVWQMKKDGAGHISYHRQEIHVPHLVLYRPWTGADADRIIQPIKQSAGLREGVSKEHLNKFGAGYQEHQMDAFMRGADKNLGQRLMSLGRRVWRDIRNF